MSRCSMIVALAALLGACGTEDDQRPATFEVVALTVLAPNCGQVQCHSSSTVNQNLAFDTLDGARDAMMELNVDLAVAAVPVELQNDLMNVILADGKPRMPPDSPLAGEDIALLRRWMVAGGPGL